MENYVTTLLYKKLESSVHHYWINHCDGLSNFEFNDKLLDVTKNSERRWSLSSYITKFILLLITLYKYFEYKQYIKFIYMENLIAYRRYNNIRTNLNYREVFEVILFCILAAILNTTVVKTETIEISIFYNWWKKHLWWTS